MVQKCGVECLGGGALLPVDPNDLDRPVIVGSIPNELTQSPVNSTNFQINKLLKTETGIVIEARDFWEPTDNNGFQQKPGGP